MSAAVVDSRYPRRMKLLLGFGIVIGVAIVDFVLAARWSDFYFTVGLPIFWRRIERPGGIADLSLEELGKRSATVAGTPLLFRLLTPDLIAFREKLFGGSMHYTPIMHGVIRHQREEGVVEVAGFVNWFVIVAMIVLIVMLRRDVIAMLPYFFAAFGVVYFIQAVRFNRVAKAVGAVNGGATPASRLRREIGTPEP
jgi:hypothetical protein